ncbi:hypothetical protein TNCV_4595403 [Trichonephila clavipes]|uniref:EGF-like domain-containing protein n=1 Tax=Trichonephila clavipes TaxID=2585209 RepID=A0A8X7BKQ1_TRICX|nr:hypothetical protein TNCV_4595403 [Trichonephila clavipes]
MDVCFCIVPLRHGDTLNNLRAVSLLVWLVEGEREKSPIHSLSVIAHRVGVSLLAPNPPCSCSFVIFTVPKSALLRGLRSRINDTGSPSYKGSNMCSYGSTNRAPISKKGPDQILMQGPLRASYACGILLQNGLYAHVIPAKTLSDDEFEDVLHILSKYTLSKEQHLSKEENAGCKCTGGSCVMKDGKQICQCPPEFGSYSATLCKACECGKGANCTYEQSGWFSVKKTCICPNGYLANGEKCIDMRTPSTNSDSTIGTAKIFPSSTRECDCGKYARDCSLSSWGKVCYCMTGYTQIGGICEAIESSTPSSTTDILQSSTVTTRITTPAMVTSSVSETTAVTPEITTLGKGCDCGKYSKDCKIFMETEKYVTVWRDIRKLTGGVKDVIAVNIRRIAKFLLWKQKICYCMEGYTQIDGWCEAMVTSSVSETTAVTPEITTLGKGCDCGKYSKDCKISFYGNRKICYCMEGYTPIDGWCEAMVTSSVSETTAVTPEITTLGKGCDCGKYSKDCKISFYGNRKICYCMEGYTPIDGWCEAMESSSVPTTDNSTATAVKPELTTLACDCGKYSKGCRIYWWGTKVCDCMSGYTQNDGICVAMESSTQFRTTDSYIRTSTSVPVTSTIFYSTTIECDCGKYSKGCRNSWFGKVCNCLPGYIQENGTCAKCYCGKNAKSCTLKGGAKKCVCKKGHSERLGICTECNCGENSLACSFYRNGTKKCDCRKNYDQKKDTCLETCLVPGDCTNGTVCTKGEGGKSFCECAPNFRGEMCEISILCEKLESTCQAMGAVCVLKDSNAYCGCPRGEKMNFKLGLCEDICNPDKCLHGKCEIIGENYKCRIVGLREAGLSYRAVAAHVQRNSSTTMRVSKQWTDEGRTARKFW